MSFFVFPCMLSSFVADKVAPVPLEHLIRESCSIVQVRSSSKRGRFVVLKTVAGARLGVGVEISLSAVFHPTEKHSVQVKKAVAFIGTGLAFIARVDNSGLSAEVADCYAPLMKLSGNVVRVSTSQSWSARRQRLVPTLITRDLIELPITLGGKKEQVSVRVLEEYIKRSFNDTHSSRR